MAEPVWVQIVINRFKNAIILDIVSFKQSLNTHAMVWWFSMCDDFWMTSVWMGKWTEGQS